MPPWYIEKNVGIQQFKDDFSLSEDEIAKIAAWADNGAAAGQSGRHAAATRLSRRKVWRIGTPDLIVTSPTVEMKALAPDWFGSIGESPTGLTEDRYVAAVEVKEVNDSGERPAAAPSVASISFTTQPTPSSSPTAGRSSVVAGARSGAQRRHLRRGSRQAPAGQFDGLRSTRSTSTRTASTRRRTSRSASSSTRSGYKPTLNFRQLFVGNGPDLDIRGLEANQRVDAYFTLPQHTKISTYEPHMHAPGVRMCLEAIWGVTVQTLNCSKYDHNWVRAYWYADDAAPLLPKGTILHVVGYFDTTPANRNVPDGETGPGRATGRSTT